MHMGPMKDSDGTFSDAVDAKCECRRCKSRNVKVREWTSRCGGFDDWQYTCDDCHFVWWVDGIDS